MTNSYRINVYDYTAEDYDDEETTFAGWFDRGKADWYEGDRHWDGNNHRYIDTHQQTDFTDYGLYRTAGGRWALRQDTRRYHNGPDRVWYIDAEEARHWLIRNDHEAAAEEHFGPVAPETDLRSGRPRETDRRLTFSLTDEQHAWLTEQPAGAAVTLRHLIDVGRGA